MTQMQPGVGTAWGHAGDGDHLLLCSAICKEREPCAMGIAAATEGGDFVSC